MTDLKDLAEFFEKGSIQELNSTIVDALRSGTVGGDYGTTGPGRQKETISQRTMVEMAARGFTNKEIAETLGRSPVTVCQVLNLPDRKELCAKIARDVAQDVDQQAMEFIKAEIMPSLETIKRVRDDQNNASAVRIAAAEKFLERRYGKANQPVNKNDGVDLDSLAIADIARQLPPGRN